MVFHKEILRLAFWDVIHPNGIQSSFVVDIIHSLFDVWAVLFCFDGMVCLKFVVSRAAGGRLQ